MGGLECKNERFTSEIHICATCTGANLGVLACKIRILRQKVVIICATRAGAIFGISVCKISVLRQN